MWKQIQWIISNSYTTFFPETFKTLENYFLHSDTFPGCDVFLDSYNDGRWSGSFRHFVCLFHASRYDKSCLMLSKVKAVASWQENKFSDSKTSHHPLNHPLSPAPRESNCSAWYTERIICPLHWRLRTVVNKRQTSSAI